MNLSGTVLKGRYCILEPVGKGGGGKVYLARDLELGVLWAVKEIQASGKSEARMLLKLSHPSLPKMIDYIEDDQKCYLVMEYVRGKSLGEYLRDGKCFSANEIVKYGMEIVDVFSYFHNQETASLLWRSETRQSNAGREWQIISDRSGWCCKWI